MKPGTCTSKGILLPVPQCDGIAWISVSIVQPRSKHSLVAGCVRKHLAASHVAFARLRPHRRQSNSIP